MGYEADLYEWTNEQADALRRRATNEIDFENLAEESNPWAKATSARSDLG